MHHRRRPARPIGAALVIVAGLAAGCSSGPGARAGGADPATTTPATTAPATTAPAATTPAATPGPATAAAPAGGADWTTYQASPDRQGRAGPTPPLLPLRAAWSATLDGAAVYGQPLFFDHRVIVATEENDLYALDPADGRVVWQVNLGPPLRDVAAAAGCGDVDPLGITSTPVVDPATGTVYAVGEVSTAGRPPVHHQLVGIDVSSGRVTRSAPADPALPHGQSPLSLLQRAALALGSGRVYVGYGGHYGDCGSYSGWVVGVPTSPGPPTISFEVSPTAGGGAVWEGGAGPAVDGSGALYVTTGNPLSGGPAPWSEAVLKLGPGPAGAPAAVFQDRAATGDLDLATGAPVLLPDGTLFAAGKTETGFLLRRSDLGLVATVKGRICGSDPDGGAAFDPGTDSLYVPCQGGGIQQVHLAGATTGWQAGQVNSTPVLAGGALLALGYPGGTLQALDPASGRVLQTLTVGRRVPHFASLSVAGGLVLVPTTAGVAAFRGAGQAAIP